MAPGGRNLLVEGLPGKSGDWEMPKLEPASALAHALEADRAAYNARFLLARRGGASVDTAAFAAVLADDVAPAVEAVAAVEPNRVAAVVASLYEIALDLLGRDYLGPQARYPDIVAAWRRLLPVLPRLLAAAPAAVAGTVTNAVRSLAALPGASPDRWIGRMAALGPEIADVAGLRDAGAIVAWQCGLAPLRQAALGIAARLPPAAAAPALGIPAGSTQPVAKALDRLQRDPWWAPGTAAGAGAGAQALRIVATVGGFKGFGGPFLSPPQILASHGAFYAFDREFVWRLHADRFGAVFLRHGPAAALPQQDEAKGFAVDRTGQVSLGGRRAVFPELAEPTTSAFDGTTGAVAVPYSHMISLIAPVENGS